MRTKKLVELQKKNLRDLKLNFMVLAESRGLTEKLGKCKSKTQVRRLLGFIKDKA